MYCWFSVAKESQEKITYATDSSKVYTKLIQIKICASCQFQSQPRWKRNMPRQITLITKGSWIQVHTKRISEQKWSSNTCSTLLFIFEIGFNSFTRWSDAIRSKDPAFFCRKAVENSIKKISQNECKSAPFHIWIVTDARRKTDLAYFLNAYPDCVKTVRVLASEEVRKERDWIFTSG